MATIAQWLRVGTSFVDVRAPEWDPLRHDDLLRESDLLGVWFDSLCTQVTLMFSQINTYDDVGLVTFRGRPRLNADSDDDTLRPFTAHLCVGSVIKVEPTSIGLEIFTLNDVRLVASGQHASYLYGHVTSIGLTPPDYGESSPQEITAQVPDWSSTFVPTAFSERKAAD